MEKYSNYKWVNSKVNEQQNSSTKNLTRHVSYMLGSHFIDHLTLFPDLFCRHFGRIFFSSDAGMQVKKDVVCWWHALF